MLKKIVERWLKYSTVIYHLKIFLCKSLEVLIWNKKKIVYYYGVKEEN